MNPNCKWKRDDDLSIKERKAEKRKYKRNSYLLVIKSKIHGVYIRKRLAPRWNRKGKLDQTNKTQ